MLISIGKIYLLTLKNVIEMKKLDKFTTVLKTVTIPGHKVMKMDEFIEIPSYVALISDDPSEPVYFAKVETKANFEEIMTDTYGRTLNLGEILFWGKHLRKVRSRKSNKK